MKKKLLEEYFTFSKKERNAVLLLVLIIVVIFIIPYYWPSAGARIDAELIAAVDSVSALKKEGHNENESNSSNRLYNDENRFNSGKRRSSPRLFYFDPNNLSAEGWISLGVKEKTVQTIEKYLSRGGRFRVPDDIKKIYGIPPQLAAQLIAYVRIKPPDKKQYAAAIPGKYPEKKVYERKVIDINEADSASLVDLRGIGPKLAGRIIKFRDRLGGFHSKDQLKEVYGLPDSTLQEIMPRLEISGDEIKKININEADVGVLSQHPYIGRNLAKVIISYREQHGDFKSEEELLKIDIMTPELISKLSQYIRFDR